MILYHGTSTEYLPQILEKGLHPRDVTGVKSNWEDGVESKPDLVYLTNAYPVFFAIATTKDGYQPVVLQVEVDEDSLYPDEDFLSYCLRQQDKEAGRPELVLKEYNKNAHPRLNKSLARLSLDHNGVVAVDRVSPQQIIKHLVLESDGRLMFIGGDAQPTPMNYIILGEEYRNCIETLFAEGVDAAVQLAKEQVQDRFGNRMTKEAIDIITRDLDAIDG